MPYSRNTHRFFTRIVVDDWIFWLYFVPAGSGAMSGVTDVELPRGFVESLVQTSEFVDSLPIGMKQADILKIKLDFSVLYGDFLDIIPWLEDPSSGSFSAGGQSYTSYNQWYIVSNDGDSGTPIKESFEFYGIQQEETNIKYNLSSSEYSREIEVIDVTKYLMLYLNNYPTPVLTFTDDETRGGIYEDYLKRTYQGRSTINETKTLSFPDSGRGTVGFINLSTFGSTIGTLMTALITGIARDGVLTTVNFVTDIFPSWKFYAQSTTDTNGGKGAEITDHTNDLYLINNIKNRDGDTIGGFLEVDDSEGVGEFENWHDFLTELFNQFLTKVVVSMDYGTSTIDFNTYAVFEDTAYNTGGTYDVDIGGCNAYGDFEIVFGDEANRITRSTTHIRDVNTPIDNIDANARRVCESITGKRYNYIGDLTELQYRRTLSRYNDRAHEVNLLLHNNMTGFANSVGESNNTFTFFIPRMPRRRIIYFDAALSSGNVAAKISDECAVTLDGTTYIENEDITTIDALPPTTLQFVLGIPGTNPDNYLKADKLRWSNERNAISGIPYVLSKAMTQTFSNKTQAVLTFTGTNILPKHLGTNFTIDLDSVNDKFTLQADSRVGTIGTLTACEYDYSKNESNVTMFMKGI